MRDEMRKAFNIPQTATVSIIPWSGRAALELVGELDGNPGMLDTDYSSRSLSFAAFRSEDAGHDYRLVDLETPANLNESSPGAHVFQNAFMELLIGGKTGRF